MEKLRQDLLAVIRAALAAVDPARLVRETLRAGDVQQALRTARAVDVVAAGKAAAAMLAAFADSTPVPLRQLMGVAAEERPRGLPPAAEWHTTVHPVPDDRSVAAGRRVLELAHMARDTDLLVLLLSGGASATMAVPAEGMTLPDKQAASRELLALGAEIHELNTVRKHLSAIKGGRLAAAHAGWTLTLALSDVVGDDLSSIGSGPTVADATTFDEALAVLARHGGRERYPAAVVDRLKRGAAGAVEETPKPGDPRLTRSAAYVIGSGRTAIHGARTAAAALGYAVHVIDRPVTGEARVACHLLVEEAARRVGAPGPVCILAAGETTVRTAGTGKGGRNQECALAMTRQLPALGTTVVAASVGTDGIDGPTDAAGAIVDTSTLARAEAADIGPPERYLEEHNSYIFFDELDDLIRTGATGTNVGDLQVILIAG